MTNLFRPRDRVLAFDKIDWMLSGRPENKDPFWRLATVLYINEHHDTVVIRWDYAGPKSTSHGHRPENLELVK